MKRINSNNSGRGIVNALTLAAALTAAGSALAVPPGDGGGGGMSVNVFGLQHTGTAGVTFAQTVDGSLLVGGLNSSPGAELQINLTEASNFEYESTIPILPIGASITLEKRGSINNGPVQPLSRLQTTMTGEGLVSEPWFGPMLAAFYQVEVWSGDELVAVVRDLSGPIVQSGAPSISSNRPRPQCERLFKSCRPDACAKWHRYAPDSDFDLPNGMVIHGDSIVIEPQTAEGVGVCPNVSYTSQFVIRGSGVPELLLHNEALHVNGIAFEALGAASMNASAGQTLNGIGIGGTGQDGVRINLESGWSGSSRATIDLSPVVLNPVGSEFTVTGVGWSSAQEPAQSGTVRCTAEATGTRVSADFSSVGTDLVVLEIWRGGQLQRTHNLINGNVALVRPLAGAPLPPIVQCGARSPILNPGNFRFIVYRLQWAGDARMDAGGQLTVADEIRLRPANPAVPMSRIESLSLTGRNLPAIEVLYVDLPTPVAGDLNCDGFASVTDIASFVLALTNPAGYAAQFPDCQASNADLNGDGQLSVTDIGPFVQLLTGG